MQAKDITCAVCGLGSPRQRGDLRRCSDNARIYQFECSVCGFRSGFFDSRDAALDSFSNLGKAERRKKQEGTVV